MLPLFSLRRQGILGRSDQGAQYVSAIVVGGGIALCAAAIMLSLSGSTLLDSDWLDYHESKIAMTFCHLIPGLVTWPCAAGILAGTIVAIVGSVRLIFRKAPRCDFADTQEDTPDQASRV
jgi:hypothetical protein